MAETESLVRLSEAVRSGSLRAADVLETSLRGIAECESSLHAFITLADRPTPEALNTAARGALAGVPIAIKDNISTKGLRTTCGSRILEPWVPPYDATVVEKVKAAGGVVVGKTNMDEFGMGSSTEFSAFGPTHNPHDLERVPGGSSGGSAAAVAAGLVPVALGSDTGGSVRQPAAHCGVVGVKPTYGRVSRYGLVAYASSLDQVGCLARTVADAAVMLGVIAGYDDRDNTSVDVPVPNYSEACRGDVRGLRVGVVSEMTGEGVDEDIDVAVANAAVALEGQGAVVDRVSIPTATVAIWAYYLIATAEASSNLARFDGARYGLRIDGDTFSDMVRHTRSNGFGEEVKRRIMLGTFGLSSDHDEFYGKAQRVRTLLIRDFQRVFKSVDVLLAPTSPCTAFKIGELIDDPVKLYLTDVCTVPANLAGLPAVSVPWGADRLGLPIGVQLLAPHFGEPTIFRTAAALERTAPTLEPPVVRASDPIL